MVTNITDKKELYSYDSIGEYVEWLSRPVPEGRGDSSASHGKAFTGTSSYEEALELCTYGDESLASEVREAQAKVSGMGEVVNLFRKIREDSVFGYIPNVPNMLCGIPQNMINYRRQATQNRIVNIVINLSASAMIDEEKIRERAVMYASAVDVLESQGYRCNVWATVTASRDSWRAVNFVRIKHDRQPLNLLLMAFPMAHPSFFRRLGFRWIEHLKRDTTHNGYGRPYTDEDGLKADAKQTLGLSSVVVLNVTEGGTELVDVVDNLKAKSKI